MIEQRVTLRYGAQQIPAIVQAVQGDTGRDVIFELADYEIPAGATANYYIDKPDDTAIYNSAEVISSTEILAHLTEQALAAPGRNNGQVRILSDGEVITSFDFVLEVEVFRGLMRMQSETEINIFDEALQAAADDAIQEILDQTPVVTGMQNSIAPAYSASSTYAVGDYVMYNAQLYKCNTAITTAEAWTAAHWTQVPIASDVSDLKSALSNIQEEGKTVDYSVLQGVYVSPTTGAINSYANYGCPVVNNNVRIKIPNGVKRIEFTGQNMPIGATAGWATYLTNTGSSTAAYVRGGTSNYIDVTDNDKYYAVTYYAPTDSVSIKYHFTNDSIRISEINEKISDVEAKTDTLIKEGLELVSSQWWNSETGNGGTNVNYSGTPNRVKIPTGCKMIVFPTVQYDFTGAAGWATYESNLRSEATDFIRGGQTGFIEVQDTDKYFVFTTDKKEQTSIPIIYVMSELASEIFRIKYPLFDKMLCFVGDSVTFGYDDANSGQQLANPFPKQVASILNAFSANEGVSSASLMEGAMSGGRPTPRAWCVDYANLYDGYDIIGTMIGINDAYRNYTLGEFTDRTTDTFYGALHTYWLGMLNKYAPENGKRLFCMLYPQYESSYAAARYKNFRQALIEVANYYSIPILDLSHEMGVSCYADSEYKYWANTSEGHSPHLTQLGADVVAPVVANYIKRMFS